MRNGLHVGFIPATTEDRAVYAQLFPKVRLQGYIEQAAGKRCRRGKVVHIPRLRYVWKDTSKYKPHQGDQECDRRIGVALVAGVPR